MRKIMMITVKVLIRCALFALAALMAGAATISAHHAFSAEFDANQPVVLKGPLTKSEWINPHAWIYLDVKDETGQTKNWAVECGAPNALLRRGWNGNSLKIGTELVVEGFRAKNGALVANARDITLPDGRKVFVGSQATGAPYEDKKQ
jgi:hypothetical protein